MPETQRTWQDIQEDALAVADAHAYLTGNKARIAEAKQALRPGVSEYWFIDRLLSMYERLMAERDALWQERKDES